MTLYQLKIFAAVGRRLNITQAASELHASQPAVSQQLKLLQEDYGAVFLVRHSQGVKLTEKGRAFLEAITPILAEFDAIERRFKHNKTSKTPPHLAIGGSRSISVSVLPNLLNAFREKHPSVEVALAAHESPAILSHLLKSELDIAIITNPAQVEGLIYEPFARMDVVAFCLATNPVAGKTLTLNELAAYPLVVKNGGRIQNELTSRGSIKNFAFRCEMSQSVKAAVRAGLGIGIVYQSAIESSLATGSLKLVNVPELKDMTLNSVITYDGRKPLSFIAQEFLSLLREKRTPMEKTEDCRGAVTTPNPREPSFSNPVTRLE